MTLTFELDPERLKANQTASQISCQRLFTSYTDIHTGPIALPGPL